MYVDKDFIQLSTEQVQLISSEEAFHFSIIPKEATKDSISFYIDEQIEFLEDIKSDLNLIHDKIIFLEPIQSELLQKSLSIYYKKRNNADLNRKSTEGLLETIIEDAINSEASDIHIEIYDKSVRIRFRIDGGLIEKLRLPKENYSEIINQIKIRSKLNITEKRLPQDGRIQLENFDVRVSFLPTQYGEKVVLRLLRREKSKLVLENLGFGEDDLKKYYQNINKPNGIILISGPTGSGKTTTLYASLQYLNKDSKNILTVEDPIEYTIQGINQVQINDEIGLSFSRTLKAFLRQDPDIIMLGEIRDAETAQMAIRASLTGHLVLSTIHTNSSIGTISRLQDMDIPSYLIAETLNISIAQRLVRLLCLKCKAKVEITGGEFFPDLLKKYGLKAESQYTSNGCDDCFFTGFYGRKAIYELLAVDSEVESIIRSGATTKGLEKGIKKPLSYQALEMVAQGQTSFEEVYPLLLNDR